MAKKLGVLSFRVSGVEVDAYSGVSNFTTDSIDFSDYSKAWVVYLDSTHSAGSPSVTIEISDDGINWLKYVDDATNILIPRGIGESKFYPKLMRLNYTANSSNGDVTFKYNQIDE